MYIRVAPANSRRVVFAGRTIRARVIIPSDAFAVIKYVHIIITIILDALPRVAPGRNDEFVPETGHAPRSRARIVARVRGGLDEATVSRLRFFFCRR